MKKYKLQLILFTICIVLTGCGTSPNSVTQSAPSTEFQLTKQADDNLPVSASNNPYLKDLEYLFETLVQEQPHFNQDLFGTEVEAIKGRLTDYDEMDFYFEVRRILAAFGDAHTKAFMNPDINETIFPIWSIKKINNSWYIYGIQEKYKESLGKELLAVNGISMQEIEQLSAPYISYENQIYLSTMLAEDIKTAEFLKHIGIIDRLDSIPVTIKDSDGVTYNIEIETFLSNDYDSYTGAWINTPETARNMEKNYYFMSLDESTLFIQYNVCQEDVTEPVAVFQQKLSGELQSGAYQTVIFDLRSNQGGRFDLFEHVIDEIGRSKRQLGFDLYCIIGEQTFSSGVLHAVQLKNYGAILVGTPTGGNVNFYANTREVELPYTGIRVSFSTKYEETIPGYEEENLIPEIIVKQSVLDYGDGIDCDIEAIKDRIVSTIASSPPSGYLMEPQTGETPAP